jgi:hypothetical protein
MMLFSVDTQEALPYVGLGTLIAAVIAAIVAGVVKIMTAQHANSTEVRIWSVSEAQRIIADLRQENSRRDVRIEALEDANERAERAHNDCLRNNAVMLNWIRWAQPEMEKAGIRVPAFNLDDSATHARLMDKGDRP